MTNKTSKWLRIILIAGLLIGLLCCLGIGAYWLLIRTMNNVTQVSNPWVRSLAWSPNGSQLAVGSGDHTITIWEVKSAKLLLTIAKHNAAVRELAWSPDGTMLAAGDQTGAVYIWNPLTGEPVEQLAKENEQDSLGFLDWSPDGFFLAYAGGQGNIMGWDITRRQKTFFAQSKNGITGISWSPDDTRLATSSTDGTITIWDRQTGKSIWIIAAHKGWTNDVDWALDGSLLASGGDDGQLKIWDAKTGKLVNQTSGSDQIFSVAWSPKANQIAWESAAGQVAITDFEKPDIHLSAGVGQVWVVAWSRDGQQLAAGTDTNTIFIWNTATGQQIQLLTLPVP
jgi:WD40 repeat protein